MAITIRIPEEIYIGEATTISIQGLDSQSITSFEWSFDEIVLVEVDKQATSLRIDPLLSGEYSIRYRAIVREGNQDKEYKATGTIHVGTRDKKRKEASVEESETEQQEVIDPYDALLVARKSYRYAGVPHFIKRNARYRGHRESEKVLNSHQEQVADLFYNSHAALHTQKLLEESIKMWFAGRNGENTTKRVIKEEKVYQATRGQQRYLLNNTGGIRRFENIMVKLNEETVDPKWYRVDGYHLIFNIEDVNPSLSSGSLFISFDSVIIIHNDDSKGLYPIMNKLKYLDERLEEMNRRYMQYENAYK